MFQWCPSNFCLLSINKLGRLKLKVCFDSARAYNSWGFQRKHTETFYWWRLRDHENCVMDKVRASVHTVCRMDSVEAQPTQNPFCTRYGHWRGPLSYLKSLFHLYSIPHDECMDNRLTSVLSAWLSLSDLCPRASCLSHAVMSAQHSCGHVAQSMLCRPCLCLGLG